MRAARLHDHTDEVGSALTIDEVPVPEVTTPNGVLVEVKGAGFCRTDNKITEGIGPDVDLPLTLGHENAGTVVEVGEAVELVEPGDDVVCLPGITCGRCGPCRSGENYTFCEDVILPGITTDGGFADYLLTAERAVVELHDLDPAHVAPVADAGLSSYHPTKRAAAQLDPDGYATVFGIGGLGHLGLQALKAMSPANLVAVDRKEEALDLADRYGADHLIDPTEEDLVEALEAITDGDGVNQVVDFVGTEETFNKGPAMLAKGGDYHLVGYVGEITVPAPDLVLSELSYHGSRGGRFSEFEEFMDLLERGKIELHTTAYDFEEINRAAQDLHDGAITGRGVVQLS